MLLSNNTILLCPTMSSERFPDGVLQVLHSHDEALIITADPASDDTFSQDGLTSFDQSGEFTIKVFTKFGEKRSILSKYLAELLERLNSQRHESDNITQE